MRHVISDLCVAPIFSRLQSPVWFHINRCLEHTVEILRYVPDVETGQWEIKVVEKRED